MSVTARSQAGAGSIKAGWLAPLGLLLLGMLPVIAGAFRLVLLHRRGVVEDDGASQSG